jgi:D-serine dehydratase
MWWGMGPSFPGMFITVEHQHPVTKQGIRAQADGSGVTAPSPILTTLQEPWLEGLIGLTSSVMFALITTLPNQL